MVRDKSEIKVAIIGVGHIGKALLKGLLNGGFKNDNFILSNRSEDNLKAIEQADWIFLTIRPNKVFEVLDEIKMQSKQKVLISMAAGVKLKKLQNLVKRKKIKVIRVMPNLAIQTGEGVIGLYSGTGKVDAQLKESLAVLGEVIKVNKEKDLDILTIISGCAPALIAYFAQAFASFNGKSEKLVLKSFLSSLKYIEQSGSSFEEIIKTVATKGGITENILNYLNAQKVNKNIETALKSGYTKLKNLKA